MTFKLCFPVGGGVVSAKPVFDEPKRGHIDIEKIVDQINRRMGDPRNPIVTRLAQSTELSGGRWKIRSARYSPNYTTGWKDLPIVKA